MKRITGLMVAVVVGGSLTLTACGGNNGGQWRRHR